MDKDAVLNKAVTYLRCATVDPQTDPIALQRDWLRREAEREGLEVVGEYADIGISGVSSRTRPGLRRLMADAKAGTFAHVLVYDLSRLSRGGDVWSLLNDLKRCGVSVHSGMDRVTT